MSVVYPTVNQAAFINGFLGVPIVPSVVCRTGTLDGLPVMGYPPEKTDYRIDAEQYAREFHVSYCGPEDPAQVRYYSKVSVSGHKASMEVRSSHLEVAQYPFKIPLEFSSFPGFSMFGARRPFAPGVTSVRWEMDWGIVVRALALALFPDFESRYWTPPDQDVDDLRAKVMNLRNPPLIVPDEAFEEGAKYAAGLTNRKLESLPGIIERR